MNLDRQNFENQTFNELPDRILCSNFYNCVFNMNTTFERCNLIGCKINVTCQYDRTNIISQEEYEKTIQPIVEE